MTAKILVPIDLSPITKAVVSWAASIARDRKASLILLHVQEPIVPSFGGDIYFPMPLEENAGIRRDLLEVVPEDPTIAVEHRFVLGSAPDEILKLANEERVDLIVMGSHGRGWLGRFLLGSVAQHVMRHAACPVLIVKQQCCAKPQCSQPAECQSKEATGASTSADPTVAAP
jgi:universal stress protein A